jgi:excisionase family DNA binding protein
LRAEAEILVELERPARLNPERQNMEARWLSVNEVATYLGVSRDTVYRWIEGRGFPAHKVGRSWKSKMAEIDEWVKSGAGAEKESREGNAVQEYDEITRPSDG